MRGFGVWTGLLYLVVMPVSAFAVGPMDMQAFKGLLVHRIALLEEVIPGMGLYEDVGRVMSRTEVSYAQEARLTRLVRFLERNGENLARFHQQAQVPVTPAVEGTPAYWEQINQTRLRASIVDNYRRAEFAIRKLLTKNREAKTSRLAVRALRAFIPESLRPAANTAAVALETGELTTATDILGSVRFSQSAGLENAAGLYQAIGSDYNPVVSAEARTLARQTIGEVGDIPLPGRTPALERTPLPRLEEIRAARAARAGSHSTGIASTGSASGEVVAERVALSELPAAQQQGIKTGLKTMGKASAEVEALTTGMKVVRVGGRIFFWVGVVLVAYEAGSGAVQAVKHGDPIADFVASFFPPNYQGIARTTVAIPVGATKGILNGMAAPGEMMFDAIQPSIFTALGGRDALIREHNARVDLRFRAVRDGAVAEGKKLYGPSYQLPDWYAQQLRQKLVDEDIAAQRAR